MVYIRAKKVKSDQYLYLVKSVWDSKKSTSKQEIVKYLGKASDVVKDDIPVDYRNDPKVLSVLASYNPKDVKKREDATKKSKQQLYKKLTEGNIHDSVKTYDEYTKIFNAPDFFDKILKPTMYRIGDEWATGKISIATEHVASNVAQTLVKIIMDKITGSANKKKILICIPQGEEHHLGCDVLETYLSIKGFKIYNMGVSMPTESILNFIDNNKPDIVMISITLEDNLSAGQRLVKKIKDHINIPVLIGGYALRGEKIPKFAGEVIPDCGLEQVPKILRKI
ncbi:MULTISPECIES: cobalamin-dependent protein [Nitrosopumilus]|uniref:Response regulator receiver protein n=1 Tax=Nitrosopumilus piranensis TaxID=1582439 RepID=A0A0C5BRL3_9ARCH|nr:MULTISPECIES: cobalamin-dependent protein [Nitrosopumilus]AJM92388.1 Response regulator receiver protein [Nitrosopumilus piranensis]KAF6244307.1 histidine kinase [Nitrosopumilus sp. b2]